MTENKGKVVSINGNLVSVEFDGNVSMNEICYVFVGDTALKSEVIRIKGNIAQVQVHNVITFKSPSLIAKSFALGNAL